MQSLICQQPGSLVFDQRPMPAPQPGEALLRIANIGICGTDLHAFAGNQPFFTYPRILGHELSAVVAEIGANEQGLQPGDRVVVMPYLSCGKCFACRRGRTNCCERLQVLGVHVDGGMQELMALPTSILLPANELPAAHAALVEPLSIGAHAVRRAAVEAGEWVLVVGAGPIGTGIMRFAQLRGARVIAMDTNAQRLNFCREHLQVDHTIAAGDEAEVQVRELTAGAGAGAVFDATGNRQALEAGVDYLAHAGRYVLVGLYKGYLSFHHPTLHARETSLLCSRNATLEDFYTVMQALGRQQFPIDRYITHTIPFDELPARFEALTQPETGVMKAVIIMEGGPPGPP